MGQCFNPPIQVFNSTSRQGIFRNQVSENSAGLNNQGRVWDPPRVNINLFARLENQTSEPAIPGGMTTWLTAGKVS